MIVKDIILKGREDNKKRAGIFEILWISELGFWVEMEVGIHASLANKSPVISVYSFKIVVSVINRIF
jgi:hypothetical protein